MGRGHQKIKTVEKNKKTGSAERQQTKEKRRGNEREKERGRDEGQDGL